MGWLLLALALRFMAFDDAAAAPLPRSENGRNLDAMLEAIRAEFRLSALACLVLHSNQVVGWATARGAWAGGRALHHTGTNNHWFTDVWLAPERRWSCLIATNAGGRGASQATDAVAARLVALLPARP